MSAVPRVYSLVNTPIATVFAYEIALLPNQPKVPQVVLLLNDRKKLNRFLDNESRVTFENAKSKKQYHSQFMASHLPPVYSTGSMASIDNLIVSGQHSKVFVSSIEKYSKSLNNSSNLLLLNPPFGTVEYLYRKLWPVEGLRPNIFVGISTVPEESIVNTKDEFRLSVSCPEITLCVSPVPRNINSYSHEAEIASINKHKEHNDMLKILKSTSKNPNSVIPISSLFYSYDELLLIRLERLIIESCIEPLAALFGCQYRVELLKSAKSNDLFRKLIREQVGILKCSYPFLKRIPNFSIALDTERLYELIIKELKSKPRYKAHLNSSLNQLNQTKINQFTGYFVQLANYKKLDCTWNDAITTLIKGKVDITKYRALNYKYM